MFVTHFEKYSTNSVNVVFVSLFVDDLIERELMFTKTIIVWMISRDNVFDNEWFVKSNSCKCHAMTTISLLIDWNEICEAELLAIIDVLNEINLIV